MWLLGDFILLVDGPNEPANSPRLLMRAHVTRAACALHIPGSVVPVWLALRLVPRLDRGTQC